MKIFKWLNEHFEELFLGVFTVTMVIVISIQVFMRYVLDNSLSWSEELARYCFIWLIYLGISYGVKSQRHIKVDVVLILLKDKWKIVLSIIANILFLSFAVFVIIYGSGIVTQLLTFGQLSPALDIPIWLVYLAGPIGMGLTALRLIQQIYQQGKLLFKKELV